MGTSIRHTPVSRRVMEASQRLRIVAKYTVGVDDIDVEAATELGIMVCHAPTEANCFGVAEQTMAFLLAVLKKVRERDADVRAGKWRSPEHATTFLGRRESDGYAGITIGLVGLGRIGTRVAQLLAPWRVRIVAYDPYIPPANFPLAGVSRGLPDPAQAIRRGVVPRRADARDPQHAVGARDRADEALSGGDQHRARQGDR
jgi:phosphoglycerate dehydrogenase-like enzyme